MLKNYIIIAIRHLARHRLFSAINILCLGVGITFCMLIGDYILQEKSVNASLRNADNQFILKSNWKVKNMGLPLTTLGPLAQTLKEEYPDLVNNYFRFNPVTNVISAGDRHFKENIAICDTSLVSMYGFKLLHGNPQQAFVNNSSVVITKDLAIKLFGTTDAINKTVSLTTLASGIQDYQVSAVLETMPYNSINNIVDKDGYNVFVPFEGSRYYQGGAGDKDWNQIYVVGMIELKKGISPAAMASPVAQVLEKRLPDNLKGLLQVEFSNLKDYYRKDNNAAVQKMISSLSLVAIFILLMAIINFINISIGTSTYRLKEIGLRKVFGSARKQLVIQYLVESLLLTTVAAIVSLGLYEAVRPLFDQALDAHLDPIWQFSADKFGWLGLFVIALGVLAGLYPAIILSSSNIINSVKGKIDTAKGGLALRKVLLVVQFTLAIFIFISTLNISRQVSYVFNKDLGYSKEQLMVIAAFPKQWDSAGVARMEFIRDGLAQLPVVRDASISFEVPDRMPPATSDVLPPGAVAGQKPLVLPTVISDENFEGTFGLHLTDGRFLQKNAVTPNEAEIVLNETAVQSLGLKNPVGARLSIPTGTFTFKVVGVVKDFNFSSFQQQIGPLAFIPTRLTRSYRFLTVKLNSTDMVNAISDVKAQWKKFSPDSPFEYTFMDDRFQHLYESELKLKKAANLATGLNLFIVFMGIFGIVSFTLAKRTREIAVRKVLGADIRNIIFLFIKDYAWLIVIANVIAWPLAYITTDRWLQSYAYRVQQDLVPYLTVAALLSLTTFVFISAQCFKAAISNPVKNLRTE